MVIQYESLPKGPNVQYCYDSEKGKKRLEVILTLAHTDYEKGLNAYAFYKTHNHGISDDLVQDTFIKTWNFLVRRGKIHIMKAFLYHVLNGLVIDEYRKHKAVSLDFLMEKGFELSGDDSEQSLNRLDGKMAITLIGSLPEKYQRVMRMRYIKMLSLKEMSFVTGETKNAIAVQVHRGLEKLKFLYNRNVQEP